MNKEPFISVIVPVHNGGKYLSQCLDAIMTSPYGHYEVIVVDDASTDDSVDIGRKMGANVLRLSYQSGPAIARNFGAERARGDVLLFVDSDVVIKQDTVTRVAGDFAENPDIAAVFGSYDDDPAEKDFFSQYKNLFHHFVHQNSSPDAVTFWAGCGAIRRCVFHEVGGFDEKKYAEPSIEDIELGYRLRGKGCRILLDKELQVKHLKRWGWYSCLKTDIFQRAVPWSRLILESGFLPSDLNMQTSHRISGVLVVLLFLAFASIVLNFSGLFYVVPNTVLSAAVVLLTSVLIILNRKVYGFFLRKKGISFMFLSVPLHFFYYFYSGATFVSCWALHKFPSFQSGLKKLGFGLLRR